MLCLHEDQIFYAMSKIKKFFLLSFILFFIIYFIKDVIN